MSGVLLDIDPLSGATEYMDYDETTGSLLITRTEDVQAQLDANEWARNDVSKPWRLADGSMWHVGSIPMTVMQGWLHDFNVGRPAAEKVRSSLDPNEEWQTFFWLRFNSSDYYKFKTAPVHA